MSSRTASSSGPPTRRPTCPDQSSGCSRTWTSDLSSPTRSTSVRTILWTHFCYRWHCHTTSHSTTHIPWKGHGGGILLFCFKNGPILASFCLLSSFSHYNFNNTNWKSVDGVRDTNSRPQDRRLRYHGAMAAALLLFCYSILCVSGLAIFD